MFIFLKGSDRGDFLSYCRPSNTRIGLLLMSFFLFARANEMLVIGESMIPVGLFGGVCGGRREYVHHEHHQIFRPIMTDFTTQFIHLGDN